MENIWNKFWFRLVVILLASVYITELGSIDPLSKRLLTFDFYKEYSVTLLISLAVLEMVYRVNRSLDGRLQWHGKVWHRLLLQLLFGFIAPLLLVLGLASLYFYLNNVNILRTDYLYYALPFVSTLILLLNVILVMTPYCIIGLRTLKDGQGEVLATVPAMDIENILPDLPSIKAQDGVETLWLEQAEVLAAYIIEGQVLIRDASGKELLSDKTLDEMENSLSAKDFFRINRQLILHRNVCKGYNALDYGKLEVITNTTLPVHTMVSQLKGKSFKEWAEA